MDFSKQRDEGGAKWSHRCKLTGNVKEKVENTTLLQTWSHHEGIEADQPVEDGSATAMQVVNLLGAGEQNNMAFHVNHRFPIPLKK